MLVFSPKSADRVLLELARVGFSRTDNHVTISVNVVIVAITKAAFFVTGVCSGNPGAIPHNFLPCSMLVSMASDCPLHDHTARKEICSFF